MTQINLMCIITMTLLSKDAYNKYAVEHQQKVAQLERDKQEYADSVNAIKPKCPQLIRDIFEEFMASKNMIDRVYDATVRSKNEKNAKITDEFTTYINYGSRHVDLLGDTVDKVLTKNKISLDKFNLACMTKVTKELDYTDKFHMGNCTEQKYNADYPNVPIDNHTLHVSLIHRRGRYTQANFGGPTEHYSIKSSVSRNGWL